MQKKPAIRQFIESERERGATDKDIRHKLLDAGWHMDIIHHAMDKMDNEFHEIWGARGNQPGRPSGLRQKLGNPWLIIPVAVVLIVLLAVIVFL
jgi:hypothetical protein